MTPRVTARTPRPPRPGAYVTTAPIFGVDRGPVSGIAPGASVIAYRALGPGGGYTSDLLAAVQQSILDGVDVLNYSISGSASVYTDAVMLAFLDAYAAGVAVNASAGNDGPGASTANHAGPWVTTVAASTFNRQYSSKMTLTSTDGATYSKAGSTLTQGVTNAPVVLAVSVPGYTGTKLCDAAFPAGSLTGQVVVCERGGNGRVEKGYNASLGGAAGMILYNPTASDVETDNHFLPAIHLEGPNTELLTFLGAHPGITATWAAGHGCSGEGGCHGRVQLARPDRRIPQARHHGTRSSDPRGPDARVDRCLDGPAGRALPGDRRHLDVVAARGGRLGSRDRGASELDTRSGEVGADDLVAAGGHQRGRHRKPASSTGVRAASAPIAHCRRR